MVCRARSMSAASSSSSRASSKEKKKEDKKNGDCLKTLIEAGPLHVAGIGELKGMMAPFVDLLARAMRPHRSRKARGLKAPRAQGQTTQGSPRPRCSLLSLSSSRKKTPRRGNGQRVANRKNLGQPKRYRFRPSQAHLRLIWLVHPNPLVLMCASASLMRLRRL